MEPQRSRIVFSGGGTAGHLFPGLAVADRMVELMPDVDIMFAGGGKRVERWHVAAAGFEYLILPCHPRPKRWRDIVPAFVRNYAGYLAARQFLAEQPVAAVIGLGGYASLPMAQAAAKAGVPLVLLEQNAVPGRATRWLAKSAVLVCSAFEDAKTSLPQTARVLVTGNPLRRDFDWFEATRGATPADAPAKKQILILGGSNGARSLNEAVPRALYRHRDRLADWQIVHQTGDADFEATVSLYQKLGLPGRVEPFLNNMPAELAAAGFAICRAGGTTLAELAAASVPAVLVPYPLAADRHQTRNAAQFSQSGAAKLIEEPSDPGHLDELLAPAVEALLADRTKLSEMGLAMGRMARPGAASEVAAVVREIVTTRKGKS